jgi:hypothetical protein
MDPEPEVTYIPMLDPHFVVHRTKYAYWIIDEDQELAYFVPRTPEGIDQTHEWVDPRWAHQLWWFHDCHTRFGN